MKMRFDDGQSVISACSSKLVCKRWSSLISGPRFNRRFVSHGRETNPPMMPDDPLELLRIIRGFLPPMPHGVVDTLRVSDCNKDLVLCGFCDVGKDYEKDERSRSYLVCNPFTKQWIALPLAPRVSSRSYGEQAGPRGISPPALGLRDGETPSSPSACFPSFEIALNLSWNQLTGDIPTLFTELDKLGILDLSHNQLTGDLQSLADMQNLVVLDVSHNNFSGRFPDTPFFSKLPVSVLSGNPSLCLPRSPCIASARRPPPTPLL
ncbi:unnamed protein product [Linum tenue]|uniref:F-box domain-containing protein n=1 Tax=Linum tenue TaxID=586396 RepID=A0AAV0JU77_9ROSI|nr:unnamed protein product [Linum tenue]